MMLKKGAAAVKLSFLYICVDAGTKQVSSSSASERSELFIFGFDLNSDTRITPRVAWWPALETPLKNKRPHTIVYK